MKLGIDISSIPYGTGVSRYTGNLVRALIPKLPPQDNLTLFGTSLRHKRKLTEFTTAYTKISNLKSRIYSLPPKFTSFFFHRLNLPLQLFTGKLDVFHAWDWYVPNPGKTKLIATVHDLAMFKFPKTANPEIKAHHELVIKRLKKFAARIIAVSETTKNDLIQLFAFSPEAITVIPEALPAEAAVVPTKSETQAILNTYQLNKPFFLMVGTQEPRKNFKKQIAAWLPYRTQYDLVIAGKPGWETLPQYPGMHVLGQVEAAHLSGLYQAASLLLYVSLYEGFGLPILEAFYHRLPVVTAKNSGMLEVAGAAASLVVPESSEDIVLGIARALANRDILIEKGISRLKLFSWATAAKATLEVYQKS